MTQKQLFTFFNNLKKEYRLIGLVKSGEELYLQEIEDVKKIDLSGILPFYPPKEFLIPSQETLYAYEKGKIQKSSIRKKPQALIAINTIDLKVLPLYNQVFEHDIYYQERRKNTLIVGITPAPESWSLYQEFHPKIEEEILEHLEFDIFLEKQGKNFNIYSGSEKGQRTLKKYGIRAYEHIQYVGYIKEEGPDQFMLTIKDKMENHFTPKIWEELGKRCIECGKCTIACPTCFCFRTQIEPGWKKNEGKKERVWDSCFYQEFSQVAGGHKFLKNTAERIHFWYEHKFVRIPHEFSLMGCVLCGRCTRVCPVDIDIKQTLKDIYKSI